MKLQAGIYLRISQDRDGKAAGVERQEKECRALAERLGWEVPEGRVYCDNDISATSGKRRPQWERLLKDIETGEIDGLLAYSSSRLYRRPAQLLPLIDLVKEREKAKSPFKIDTCVSGTIDLTTADGRMIAGLLALIDQAEAEKIGERVAGTKRTQREKGMLNGGGPRPFGYDRIRDADGNIIKHAGLKLNVEEVALIKEAAARIVAGESLYRITMDFNTRGLTTASGGRWKPTHLRRTLVGNNPDGMKRQSLLLLGGANWPAILTADEARAVRAAIDANKAPARSNGGNRKYVLSGLVFCRACGSKMLGSAGAYRCFPLVGGCGKTSITTARQLEHLVDEEIDRMRDRGLAVDPAAAPNVTDADPEARDAALAELAEIEARISEVEAAVADGTLKPAPGQRILDDIESRRAAAAEEFGTLVVSESPFGGWDFEATEDLYARWDAGELTDTEVEDLNQMFRAFVSKVVIGPRGPDAIRGSFDPSRVELIPSERLAEAANTFFKLHGHRSGELVKGCVACKPKTRRASKKVKV